MPHSPDTFASRFAAALMALCLLAPASARADAESDAKDLFARGRDFRAKHDCADAVILFKKAVTIYPSGLGSVRNLAECEEELRHPAAARRSWLDLKRALVTTTDPKYQGWAAEAQSAADRLAPLVAKITIDVVGVRNGREVPRAELDDLVIRVNGETLPLALLGTELERDPGAYTIQAERTRAKATDVQSMIVLDGDSRRVKLRLASDGPPPPPVAARSEVDDPNSGRRLVGWVTFGVGVASLVGAGISLGVRQSALGELNDKCTDRSACPSSLQSTVDRGKLASLLVNVFGAVGIVATGTGFALVVTSPSAPPPPRKTGLTLRPMLGSASGLSAEWILP